MTKKVSAEQARAALARIARHFVLAGGRAQSSPYGGNAQEEIEADYATLRAFIAQAEAATPLPADVEEALEDVLGWAEERVGRVGGVGRFIRHARILRAALSSRPTPEHDEDGFSRGAIVSAVNNAKAIVQKMAIHWTTDGEMACEPQATCAALDELLSTLPDAAVKE